MPHPNMYIALCLCVLNKSKDMGGFTAYVFIYAICLLVAGEHMVVVTLMAWYSPPTNPVHGCSLLNTEVEVRILRCWI